MRAPTQQPGQGVLPDVRGELARVRPASAAHETLQAGQRPGVPTQKPTSGGYVVSALGRIADLDLTSGRAPYQHVGFMRNQAPIHRAPCVYIAWLDMTPVYVGYSSNPTARLGQHAATSPWWKTIDGYHVLVYGEDFQARTMEVWMIEFFKPQANRQRGPKVRVS